MSQDTVTTSLENSSLVTNHVRDSVVYSVEQLNVQIRKTLEGELGIIWLQAEISNFKPHSSGHFYFSLKDSKAQISAIMFRGSNSKLRFKPHDGLEVIVRGRITVYEPRGTYQIVCETMEPVGAGALQKQFEQLKEKLKLEGLFDSDRKKVLPSFPKNIVVVTSPTGAAIQDILNIMKRRAPHVGITIVPAIVQGAAAAPILQEAFRKAELLKPDVIIIGRGGGSIEDMWCFNDEGLARLIANCKIPVISAVGHEIDFTICDFVADLRAPTPSAAAELVAKSSNELLHKLSQWERLIRNSFERMYRLKRQAFFSTTQRLADPKKKLADYNLRNDDLLTRLEQSNKVFLEYHKKDISLLLQKLVPPTALIEKTKSKIQNFRLRLRSTSDKFLTDKQFKLSNAMSLLDSFSPLKVVDRGFSITTHQSQVVKSITEIKIADVLDIQIADGHIKASVLKIDKKSKSKGS